MSIPMVAAAAVAVVAVLAFLPPARSTPIPEEPAPPNPFDKYRDTNIFYNIQVVNNMPNKETMEVNCHRVGMTFSLGPHQRGIDKFYPSSYMAHFDIAAKKHVEKLAAPPRVFCVWAYAGNYMNAVPIFSVDWPEAARCAGTGPGESYCTATFEDGQLFVEAPGSPRRLLGDLAIKRCKNHFWFFGRTGYDCSLPTPRSPYAGYVLDGWIQYRAQVDEINNL
ncbi:hypothetical protein ACP70R_018941 [Stipagrostis hirtigluma subsp. patula]